MNQPHTPATSIIESARAGKVSTPDYIKSLDIKCSGAFLDWLFTEQISLALSTYQGRTIIFLGCHMKRALYAHYCELLKPMGIWADRHRLVVADNHAIWDFRNRLAAGKTAGPNDTLYLAESCRVTGSVDVHDIAVGADGRPCFAITAFSCVGAMNPDSSFETIWKPPFITKLLPIDACHLNGLAMRDGVPRYVTYCRPSGEKEAWREKRNGEGELVDIVGNEVLCRGLTMPHSPRWHDGRLWLINSGEGQFGFLDEKGGKFEPVARLTGYGRGLAIHGNWAIIGLSKPRHDSKFGGLPMGDSQEPLPLPRCGVVVVSLKTGTIDFECYFDGGVTELYDVAVLAGISRPRAVPYDYPELQTYTAGDLFGPIPPAS